MEDIQISNIKKHGANKKTSKTGKAREAEDRQKRYTMLVKG